MAKGQRSVSVIPPRVSKGLRRDLQALVDSNRITLNMRNQVNKAVRKAASNRRSSV